MHASYCLSNAKRRAVGAEVTEWIAITGRDPARAGVGPGAGSGVEMTGIVLSPPTLPHFLHGGWANGGEGGSTADRSPQTTIRRRLMSMIQ